MTPLIPSPCAIVPPLRNRMLGRAFQPSLLPFGRSAAGGSSGKSASDTDVVVDDEEEEYGEDGAGEEEEEEDATCTKGGSC